MSLGLGFGLASRRAGGGVAALPAATQWRVYDMASTRGDIVELGGLEWYVNAAKQTVTSWAGNQTVGTLTDLNTPGAGVAVRWNSGDGQNNVSCTFGSGIAPNSVKLYCNSNTDRFPDVRFKVAYWDGTTWVAVATYTTGGNPGSGAAFTQVLP